MSVFLYEPFYDIERFFDEALSGRQESASENKAQRRIGRGEGDGASRSLKPRYVPNVFPNNLSIVQLSLAWTSTKTLKRTW